MALFPTQDGIRKEVVELFVHDGGVWKEVGEQWVFEDGVWKEVYSSKTLVTVELSSGTWVCPPRTTNIEVMVGRGGTGRPSGYTWGSDTNIELAVIGTGSPVQNQGLAGSRANSEYSKFPTAHTSNGFSVSYTRHVWSGVYTADTRTVRVRRGLYGTKTKTGNGWDRTTIEIPASRYYRWNVGNMQIGTSRSATRGASTTGLGQTFQGGLGGTATSRTVNNVPVAPGQSYQVSVPSGGFLRITYYE